MVLIPSAPAIKGVESIDTLLDPGSTKGVAKRYTLSNKEPAWSRMHPGKGGPVLGRPL